MREIRACRWASLLLLLVLAVSTWWRSPAQESRRVPHEDCKPWMADALPGIGPARRAGAAMAIREGRLEQLPYGARTAARRLFSGL